MSLTAGARVGPYEIVTLIGAGGMGEVYRARDTRLGRDVAMKVLPAGVSRDPDRLRRFEQEARAASLLNHPNIIVLFDVGTADDTPYVVGELLDGETLREKLRAGPLPVRKAVEYTRQIAQGLAAAHAKGIIHRDLKPENVFVTRDGVVKLLDFGLAKLKPDLAPGGETTIAGAIGTTPGLLLGTVGYMAPEQLRGHDVDHRADIFSLGAILYELLSGRRAFAGDAMPDTLSAILHTDPAPLATLRSDVPPSVDRVTYRCLEKDPADRYQSARDLAFSLEAFSSDGGRGTAIGTVRRPRWPLAAVASGVAIGLLIAGAVGALLLRRSPDAPATVRVHRLTDLVGLEESPAMAPDGKSVAFTVGVNGHRQIFQRLVRGGAALQVTRDPADHLFPRWTPDSSAIIYYSPPAEANTLGTLWEISAFGGAPRRLASSLGGADVSHDGTRLAYFTSVADTAALVVAPRAGGQPREVIRLDPDRRYASPRWSPDDRWIAYSAGFALSLAVFRVPLDGGRPEALTDERDRVGGFTWHRNTSEIIYSSDRGTTVLYLAPHNLWLTRIGEGQPRQITFGENSYLAPDAGPDGRLVAERWRAMFDVWKYPVGGSPLENARQGTQITRQTGHVQTPSVSAEGQELVYLSDAGGHGNVWTISLTTGERRQITAENDPAIAIGVPVVSPNGREIAFFVRQRPSLQGNIWLVDSDGSNPRLLVREAGWATWSADSAWIYFGSTTSPFQIGKIRRDGSETTILQRETLRGSPAPGLDGTLYFTFMRPTKLGTADLEIRAAKPETGPPRTLARIPEGLIPEWQLPHPVLSPDGRWLALPLTHGVTTNLWAISTADGSLRQLTDFGARPTFIARRVSWAPDGRAIFAAVGEGDADIVLLDGLRH